MLVGAVALTETCDWLWITSGGGLGTSGPGESVGGFLLSTDGRGDVEEI